MEDNTLENLDFILDQLRRYKEGAIGPIFMFKSKFQASVSNTHLLDEYILELLGKKFIREANRDSEGRMQYSITVEGRIFEGYINRQNRLQIEKKRLGDLENENALMMKAQVKLNTKLNRLTFWLVLFAFLSLGWTIWKDTHFFCIGH